MINAQYSIWANSLLDIFARLMVLSCVHCTTVFGGEKGGTDGNERWAAEGANQP